MRILRLPILRLPIHRLPILRLLHLWGLAAALAGAGCVDKAEFVQGRDLSLLMLSPTGPTEGIFPDVSVLSDPANPFADINYYSIDAVRNKDAIQWKLNTSAAHAARFYVWATILAKQAPDGGGEAQFYTATALQDVYFFAKAAPSDLPLIRKMAIAAFTVVLTKLSDTAVTYDASGRIAYELLTPSLRGILDLGGTAPAGWFLVTDDSGVQRAVRQ